MKAEHFEIVLVEDNEFDAELTMRALKKSKVTSPLLHLKDGEAALEYLFCRGAYAGRNKDQRPRLIILDLKMPKVDGMEVLRMIKADEQMRLVPVVLLTSSKEDKDIEEGYALGVNSYIVKPVEFESFMTAVSNAGLYWLQINQVPFS